jgi:hypothetical protein
MKVKGIIQCTVQGYSTGFSAEQFLLWFCSSNGWRYNEGEK